MNDDETKIMSRKELMREIGRVDSDRELVLKEVGVDEYKVKKVKTNQEKKPEGGKVKMRERRSRLGAAVIFSLGALVGGAATKAYMDKRIEEYERNVAQTNAAFADYKDRSILYSDQARMNKLNTELEDQVEEANNFLIRTMQNEDKFWKFVQDARRYVGRSTPSGELEEKAAKEVKALRSFISAYEGKKRRLKEMAEECYESSTEAIEKRDAPLPEYREAVEKANGSYTTFLAALAVLGNEKKSFLSGFISHTERYPLKGREEKKKETEQEIPRVDRSLNEACEYIEIFEGNSQTQDIIPVRVRSEQGKQDHVAAADGNYHL
ncbi:hypothetical protein KY343_01490 [Candidatus Woesearchaeota archaeon]|nr:hypothetical protein [Candidatus Woesearchaeota archaeon]